MMTNDTPGTPRKPRGTRKAAAATTLARARDKLDRHDEAKRQREARERARREALRRSLLLAAAQARKVDREEWRQRELHLAAAVGRLALTELAATGTADLRLDPALLHHLVEADLKGLKEWLAHMLEEAADQADHVDIALPGDDATSPAVDGT